MPHSRMKHIAVLPCSKSCSAYATNLIASILENNFLLTIFQVTKIVELTLKNKTSKFPLIFLSDWLMQFWNNLLTICHSKNYVYTTVDGQYWHGKSLVRPDTLPMKFSCHMSCYDVQKPRLSRATLTSTLFSPFGARQGRILLHSATRHRVDAPIGLLNNDLFKISI